MKPPGPIPNNDAMSTISSMDFARAGQGALQFPWAKRRVGSGSEADTDPRGQGTHTNDTAHDPHDPHTLHDAVSDRVRRIARLRLIARLMDNAIEIPGTGIRFGLDSLIGLIPGAGDAVTAGVSLYIVYEAAKLGATRGQLAMMLGNIAIDTLVGTIPVLGDLFDLTFKANVRNLRMMGIEVNAG